MYNNEIQLTNYNYTIFKYQFTLYNFLVSRREILMKDYLR